MKILFTFFALTLSHVTFASQTIHDFMWSDELAQELNSKKSKKSEGFCSFVLEKQIQIPNRGQLKRIDATISQAQAALDAYKNYWIGGGRELTEIQRKEFRRLTIRLIHLRNKFGFEYGVKKGFVQLSETIGCLVLLDGFIPTKEDLDYLASVTEKQLDAIAKIPAEKRTTEDFFPIKWNVSQLQKLEGNFAILHGKLKEKKSSELFMKYLEIVR